jgi:hypothetical protein
MDSYGSIVQAKITKAISTIILTCIIEIQKESLLLAL